MNVNKVLLVGRLTRDVDLRTTNSGQTVANVGIATNRFWKDQGGQKQEQTEYHSIVLFGRLAEIAGQYLSKGQEAYFEGRLQTRSYTGKDGVERRVTEVVAENMQLGSRPQGGGGYNNSNAGQNQPRQQAAPQSGSIPANQSNQGPSDQPAQASGEDIPTINLDEEQDEIKLEDVPF